MTGPALTVESVSYDFGARPALADVSFTVEAGSFCALFGPNGAGKSTLFSLLTRLFTPKTGRISVAGHDLARAPRAALARIGVVFQQPTLDLDLTVRRNLLYYAALHGLSGKMADRAATRALERLDMAERAGERVSALNGGHRRRMEIARTLMHEPAILLLDEPTVGLDAMARRAITDHAHALCAAEGLTVLWATHLVDEVRPEDRLVALHRGRVVADGTAGGLAAGRPLEEAFAALIDAEGAA